MYYPQKEKKEFFKLLSIYCTIYLASLPFKGGFLPYNNFKSFYNFAESITLL